MTRNRRSPLTHRSRLLAELAPTVVRAVRTTGVHPSDVEEAVQRVLIRLGRHTERLSSLTAPERNAYAWVAGVREARKRQRARAARPVDPIDPDAPPIDAVAANPEADLMRRQLAGAIDTALASLDTGARSAAVLVLQEDVPQAEAAATLDVSRGTLASRLRRAREALRRLLGGS